VRSGKFTKMGTRGLRRGKPKGGGRWVNKSRTGCWGQHSNKKKKKKKKKYNASAQKENREMQKKVIVLVNREKEKNASALTLIQDPGGEGRRQSPAIWLVERESWRTKEDGETGFRSNSTIS